MKKIFTLLIFIGTTFYLQAQKIDTKYIPNQMLIQFSTEKEAGDFLKNKSNYNIVTSETVSGRFHIYLLTIDDKIAKTEAVKEKLSKLPGVANIQYNHLVSLREGRETFPNDSLFDEQWSLYNDGTGGLADADIDATDAWDITTGGLTATGDTIVVAIIDGGGDIHHEDVDFWKNYAEIPNNQIDDDQNGYVDDYDGWNAYDNNGTIPLHNHGIHVMGIAGAIGNNNIGVSGVNWTVKTLPIAGSSTTEAIVVRALSYLYVVREQYNNTNGQEGAFVVADNCSFGVDKGNPANYPIWEAMYDSLGRLGVLSCAATANKPWDIDSVGDVPTAFSTDYMIAVTNTTRRDQLYTSAAWGDTTIDLGSPGTSIKSTLINNGYGYKTGTSMATPHVTGSVALLISAADSGFMVNFKNNPAEGSLLLKNFLLQGVDTIPDLVGKTVSSGRLNIYNAIMLLQNAPVIVTDPDSVYAEAPLNSQTEEVLVLSNGGNDTLFYSVSIENQPQWITLSSDSGAVAGGGYEDITLYFDDQDLDTGYYYCTMNITGKNTFSKQVSVAFYVYDNVGIVHNRQQSVKVYPNPAKDELLMNISLKSSEKITVALYNQTGKKVLEKDNVFINGGKLIKLDLTNLPGGVYYYQIISSSIPLKTGKVVKMK